jgi:subtilisin family serine protease
MTSTLRWMKRGCGVKIVVGLLLVGPLPSALPQEPPTDEKKASYGKQKDPSRPGLIDTKRFLRLDEAQKQFKVTGKGLTVAILDTGVRVSHADFRGRVPASWNCTPGGNKTDVTDEVGNGTHLAGIIAANGGHQGIAPEARIIPVKVLSAKGSGSFEDVERGLQWVLENRVKYGITVVNLAIGDGENHRTLKDAGDKATSGIVSKIRALRDAKVPVVVAAGNSYYRFNAQKGKAAPRQGMAFPAVVPETISVGAVYDSYSGEFKFGDGAVVKSATPGQLSPFSQRLHDSDNPTGQTDIFAPGVQLVSTGNKSDDGESIQSGTSQASAVVSGTILLMQEYYRRVTNGESPTVDQLETWLRRGGVPVEDATATADNVLHTNRRFIRLDALGALDACRRGLQIQLLDGLRTGK